jgi:hypothetical protein
MGGGMISMRYSDLVLELVELCRDIRSDLTSTLAYYRASAYKRELADKIKVKVDHLRAVFQILGDDELSDAMADYDALLEGVGNIAQANDCAVTARLNVLFAGMDPALTALVRRFSQSQSIVRPETVNIMRRHRQTLMGVCKEGSRSLEILRRL